MLKISMKSKINLVINSGESRPVFG